MVVQQDNAFKAGANLKKISNTFAAPHARIHTQTGSVLVLGARRTFLCIHY